MAQILARKSCARNPQSLPLFDWAERQSSRSEPPSLAVRELQKAGLSRSAASLYASLAGLPTLAREGQL